MHAVNFPFIKSILFKEIDCPNDEKLNRRIKSEFYMFVNCRKWRYMNFIRHGTEENPYCIFELHENILYITANSELIKIFLETIKKFENIEGSNIKFESDTYQGSETSSYKFHSEKRSEISS